MLKLTTDYGDGTAPETSQTLDELAREGARRMSAEALKLEADEYVEKLRHLRDAKGHALVVARSCGRGDGALGFCAALRAVYPETREQRCWVHLRTTNNPIESPFATVKARTRLTKGAGSRIAGLAMAFKLALAAQARWRKVNAPHLVALVRAGVTFKDGARVTEAQSAAFTDTESTHEVAA